MSVDENIESMLFHAQKVFKSADSSSIDERLRGLDAQEIKGKNEMELRLREIQKRKPVNPKFTQPDWIYIIKILASHKYLPLHAGS